MKPRLGYVDSVLSSIRADGLYRTMPRVKGASGPYVTVGGRRLVNLCSNDYLGIGPSRVNTRQMQSSSRLVSGNAGECVLLERALARHRSQQGALAFPTGYMANLGVIVTLAQKGDTIFSDELNHASIIEACRLSGASVYVYGHNDMDQLSGILKGAKGRKFVVTEGVFSMDGDMARLDELVELAGKHDAVTILDDAHGDFVVGSDGRGTASRFGVARDVDVHTGSLSKALGSFGGYVASQQNVIEYCVNRARPFIYTSALPASLAGHALERMGADLAGRRKTLRSNVRAISKGLAESGYDVSRTGSHIIPVIVGSEKTAMGMGRYLSSRGIFAQPIRYPTVARGRARIRVSVTAWLRETHVRRALDAFEAAAKRFRIT